MPLPFLSKIGKSKKAEDDQRLYAAKATYTALLEKAIQAGALNETDQAKLDELAHAAGRGTIEDVEQDVRILTAALELVPIARDKHRRIKLMSEAEAAAVKARKHETDETERLRHETNVAEANACTAKNSYGDCAEAIHKWKQYAMNCKHFALNPFAFDD